MQSPLLLSIHIALPEWIWSGRRSSHQEVINPAVMGNQTKVLKVWRWCTDKMWGEMNKSNWRSCNKGYERSNKVWHKTNETGGSKELSKSRRQRICHVAIMLSRRRNLSLLVATCRNLSLLVTSPNPWQPHTMGWRGGYAALLLVPLPLCLPFFFLHLL